MNNQIGLAALDGRSHLSMEMEEVAIDLIAWHLLLFDNLMLSMVVDQQGRLLGANFSVVSDFCEPVFRGVTEELMNGSDVEEAVRIGCFSCDIREETTQAFDRWLNFRITTLGEDGEQLFEAIFGPDET